jgi:hypothetical protein
MGDARRKAKKNEEEQEQQPPVEVVVIIGEGGRTFLGFMPGTPEQVELVLEKETFVRLFHAVEITGMTVPEERQVLAPGPAPTPLKLDRISHPHALDFMLGLGPVPVLHLVVAGFAMVRELPMTVGQRLVTTLVEMIDRRNKTLERIEAEGKKAAPSEDLPPETDGEPRIRDDGPEDAA